MRSNQEITFEMITKMEEIVENDMDQYDKYITVDKYIANIKHEARAGMSNMEFKCYLLMLEVDEDAAFEMCVNLYINAGLLVHMCYTYELQSVCHAITGDDYYKTASWDECVNLLTDVFIAVIKMWKDNGVA